MTLPDSSGWRALVASRESTSVATKNMVANTAVKRLKKLAEPVAPKTLPDEPDPKAAPISAPLPCCNNTNTMMPIAQSTWIVNTRFGNQLIFIPLLHR
jgi:hypothetical protein